MVSKITMSLLVTVSLALFVLSIFLYVTLNRYEHRIRRLHGALRYLVEFHHDYVNKNTGESWEDYIDVVKSEQPRIRNYIQISVVRRKNFLARIDIDEPKAFLLKEL